MSNQRLLAMGLILITGCAAYVLEKIVDLAAGWAGVSNVDVFGGIHLSVLVGVVVAVAAALFAWMNPRVQEGGQAVAAELRKVTWPSGAELRAATTAVVVATLVAAAILGVMDFMSAKVMSDWIPAGIHWARGIFS